LADRQEQALIENYMGFPDGIGRASLAERARQRAVKFSVEILLSQEKALKATFTGINVNMADGNMLI